MEFSVANIKVSKLVVFVFLILVDPGFLKEQVDLIDETYEGLASC